MAATQVAPRGAYDLVTMDEGLAMLRDTGYPLPKSTAERLLAAGKHPVHRMGRDRYVSMTSLLTVHRDWVLRRIGG